MSLNTFRSSCAEHPSHIMISMYLYTYHFSPHYQYIISNKVQHPTVQSCSKLFRFALPCDVLQVLHSKLLLTQSQCECAVMYIANLSYDMAKYSCSQQVPGETCIACACWEWCCRVTVLYGCTVAFNTSL
jgi:hypothetical protein